jgi:Mg2+ and Co2+ transporter CorA
MSPKETGYYGMDVTYLPQDKIQLWAFVFMVLKLLV